MFLFLSFFISHFISPLIIIRLFNFHYQFLSDFFLKKLSKKILESTVNIFVIRNFLFQLLNF